MQKESADSFDGAWERFYTALVVADTRHLEGAYQGHQLVRILAANTGFVLEVLLMVHLRCT